MKITPLGVAGAIALATLSAPIAGAYPTYGGCLNGYQQAGRHVGHQVQDVCALPSVIDGFGYVNPVVARAPEPPWPLPDYVVIDAAAPAVCTQYDIRYYESECAPPWIPMGL